MSRIPIALKDSIIQCSENYYKLLLLVGTFSSGKTKMLKILSKELEYVYVNLNLMLGERLINLNKDEREILDIYNLMREYLHNEEIKGLILDNIEIIFCPILKRNPLITLKKLSRNKIIIASWPGKFEKNKVIYATPNHIEFFEEKVTDIVVYTLNQ
ncbi:MAG: BREX-3 system P-loop-containing protein BrxF [Candidatus Odinarchaeota archaeon]